MGQDFNFLCQLHLSHTEPQSNLTPIFLPLTAPSNSIQPSIPLLSLLHHLLSKCMFPVTCDL